MATVTAITPNDMTAWDLTDLRDGTGLTNTATDWVVEGADPSMLYTFAGTGLSYSGGGGNPLPDGGTLDTFMLEVSGSPAQSVVGAIDAALFSGFVLANDRVGLQKEWFKGADTFDGSTGSDHLLGWKGNDVFDLGDGGEDWAEGGQGNDTFNVNTAITALDRFDGGSGSDKLIITGTHFYDFSPVGLTDVELVKVSGGSNQLIFQDANIGSDGLVVDGSAIGTANFFNVFMTSGSVKPITVIGGKGADVFGGGDGADTYTGNKGDDQIRGNGAADTLTGSGGKDNFVYFIALDSTGPNYDEIADFDTSGDEILLTFAINDVNPALTAGALSTASFNADMAAAITAAVLGKHDVMLFTPDAGTLAGETFLIVDVNAKKGYQANKDLVILMGPDSDLSNFNAGDFTTIG